MKRIQLALYLIAIAGLCCTAHASVIPNFDLNGTLQGNVQELALDAGQYTVSLRSGLYTAWSNFPTTSSGCTNDCTQGWLNFYSVYDVLANAGVYVENGIGTPFADYNFGARLAYSTPAAALAAAAPYQFTLNTPATVQIAIPDCDGCFLDNRGGLSFTVAAVPEPAAAGLFAIGLAALTIAQRNSRHKKAVSDVVRYHPV